MLPDETFQLGLRVPILLRGKGRTGRAGKSREGRKKGRRKEFVLSPRKKKTRRL